MAIGALMVLIGLSAATGAVSLQVTPPSSFGPTQVTGLAYSWWAFAIAVALSAIGIIAIFYASTPATTVGNLKVEGHRTPVDTSAAETETWGQTSKWIFELALGAAMILLALVISMEAVGLYRLPPTATLPLGFAGLAYSESTSSYALVVGALGMVAVFYAGRGRGRQRLNSSFKPNP